MLQNGQAALSEHNNTVEMVTSAELEPATYGFCSIMCRLIVVIRRGFEPLTFGLGIQRSIQLN